MLNTLPTWIEITFIIITFIGLFIFSASNKNQRLTTLIVLAIVVFQSILAILGFYDDLATAYYKILALLIPSLGLISFGLLPKQRSNAFNQRNIIAGTFFHAIRIPIAIIFFYLYTKGYLPAVTTYLGKNYDILVGLAALILTFLLYRRILKPNHLIYFHLVGLLFCLTSIVLILGSTVSPFQFTGFEQPNIIAYRFPFILWISVLAPIFIYSHLIDLLVVIKRLKQLS